MNQNDILPSPELEENDSNAAEGHFVSEKVASQNIERNTNATSSYGAVAVSSDGTTAQTPVVGLGSTPTAAVTQLDVPAIAEDIDLIEKIWVKKAKEIVEATNGDPHKQTDQINKMKVEYIKKRYNKDIKFKEE